jgi:hypothetical protein
MVVLLDAGLLLIAGTKIPFIAWGIDLPKPDFMGISGHAMRTAALMPIMLYLLLQKA